MAVRDTAAGGLVRGRGKPQALYRQIAEALRADIRSGRLPPGERLPAVDRLARAFHVNRQTIRQALAELTVAGLVRVLPARGTFVADQHPDPAPSRHRPLSVGWILNVNDDGKTGRYHTEIMDCIQAELRQLNGHLVIISTSHVSDQTLTRTIGEARLDGVILIGAFQRDTIRHLAGNGIPTVLIDDVCRGARVDSVLVDNRGGGYQAAAHLLQLGHRRLAFVAGPHGLQITRDRLEGAYEAMDEAGLDRAAAAILHRDFSPQGGQSAMSELLHGRPRPTGIFFFNDEMASSALQVIHEDTDLRVPQDISIVGFDNTLWASMTRPALTTVHVEKEMIAKAAVDRLKQRLSSRDHTPTTTVVPTRLIPRNTTASIQKDPI